MGSRRGTDGKDGVGEEGGEAPRRADAKSPKIGGSHGLVERMMARRPPAASHNSVRSARAAVPPRREREPTRGKGGPICYNHAAYRR